MTNATIDLSKFCAFSKADSRTVLHAPFKVGDFIYASNGHMGVRVPAAGWPEEVREPAGEHETKVAAIVVGVFAKHAEASHPAVALPELRTQRCRACKGAGFTWGSKCDSCDGEGSFQRHGYDYECKACDGDGYDECEKDHPGAEKQPCRACFSTGLAHLPGEEHSLVGSSAVRTAYLAAVARLPGVTVHPNPDDPHIPVLARFDGGIGLLMPCREEYVLRMK
jgi:hypothetical protein